MDWLTDTILQPSSIQSLILICVVSAIGLRFGQLKIFGISLGITFVFFIGILLGHFRLNLNKDMIEFAQNFGLVLFIYSLGLQVGTGFFASLKKGGIQINILASSVVILGLVLAIIISKVTGVSISNMAGILAGASTNTPALASAQQALVQIGSPSKVISDMALACAVTYPLGVIGVIIGGNIMRYWAKDNEGTKKKVNTSTYISQFIVSNPAVIGKDIAYIMKLSKKSFVISRIWRDGKVTIPRSDSILEPDDLLLVISPESDVESIKLLFGNISEKNWNTGDIDWDSIDNSNLVSKMLVVTKHKLNGVRLGTLRLRNTYGVNVTRINRADIDLLPSPNLALQIGDKVTVVGEAASIHNISEILGDEVKRLEEPNLMAIFIGIALGLVLGALPIQMPGMSLPVKLGLAGGPIVVGILMGAFGPRFNLAIYTTHSANLMMRQLGLVMYLACLGINSGERFFETILKPEGALWVLLGLLVTLIPIFIMGFISIRFIKMSYAKCMGFICGAMANPIALEQINASEESGDASISYATVYPVSMFLRIISTQVLVMIL